MLSCAVPHRKRAQAIVQRARHWERLPPCPHPALPRTPSFFSGFWKACLTLPPLFFCCWGGQAMMELGATVCVPNTEPKCGECPVAASCAALRGVREHEAAGGEPGAAGAPRVADYPTKVRPWSIAAQLLRCRAMPGCLRLRSPRWHRAGCGPCCVAPVRLLTLGTVHPSLLLRQSGLHTPILGPSPPFLCTSG